MEYREFAARLLEKDQFLILSHKNPDGDTLGSALQRSAQDGKNCVCLSQ